MCLLNPYAFCKNRHKIKHNLPKSLTNGKLFTGRAASWRQKTRKKQAHSPKIIPFTSAIFKIFLYLCTNHRYRPSVGCGVTSWYNIAFALYSERSKSLATERTIVRYKVDVYGMWTSNYLTIVG